jgi:Transglycosylase SLT domain
MRRKLLLTIALAILAAAVAASAVNAQTDLLDQGTGDVNINLPGGQDVPDVGGQAPDVGGQVLPACSNGSDDDGDGAVDLGDPGCTGPLDGDEYNPPQGSSNDSQPEGETTTPTTPTGPTGPGYDEGGGGGAVPIPGTGLGGGRGGGGALGGAGGGGGDADRDRHRGPAGAGDRKPIEPPPIRKQDGRPTRSNPTVSIADFGPTPIGVPNFMIDQFSIPPFMLPIYQACGTQYGIDWQVLASINRIETAFGTNLNVSTAGAVGWMQFLPSTWKAYGVDANEDGRKDPYNPVDAVCAAARYLDAAGYSEDIRGAIFAYNHADWYVDEVLLYANQYGKLPEDLVGSLTGLTEGAHFPIAAKARYADDISEREALERTKPSAEAAGNVADIFESSPTRRGINIYSREGAPVVAVNDGVIKKIGNNDRLGRFIVLQDAYGNRFTYAQLGKVAEAYPVPKERELSAKDFRLVSPGDDPKPDQPASAGGQPDGGSGAEPEGETVEVEGPVNTEDMRERLYAFPERRNNVDAASLSGQLDALLGDELPGYESFKAYFSGVLEFDRKTMDLRPLREGSKVVGGTVIGRVGKTDELAPHIHFAIRPTGRGAPKIDPKPILDGWKLLEATAIYRAAGKNPFDFDSGATIGQILLMSKTQLERRVLADPRLEIYSCGREDIRTHQIDRRILAAMEYLAESGFRLTVTSLKCGHSYYTASGSVSHHSSGNAVDIAMVNGIPILGHQGRGSITEAVVQQLLQLQGTMEPAQVISLMDMGGPTFAMGDHHDHIHIGYEPQYSPDERGKQFVRLLEPDQWQRLIDRIAEIENPEVPTEPSQYALPAGNGNDERGGRSGRASDAHIGE